MGCREAIGHHRILILGGGFAGVYAARRLERSLGCDPNVEITLINRDNYLLFTPMLHEVAGGELQARCIVSPIRKLLHGVHFFCGDVHSIDLARKRVVAAHGAHPHALDYDQLVLALGCRTQFFGLSGVEERAFTMKSLDDAIRLHDHLIAQLDEADFDCAAKSRQSLLTFVVAGGGFAGVETAGSVNDFLRDSVRFYPNLNTDMLRVVLVASGSVILPELKETLGRYARGKLAGRGVEVLTDVQVIAADAEHVELSDGRRIASNTLIWTAGNSAHPLIASLPCKKERGRIVVNEFLEIPDWPGVFAIGDCASLVDARTGTPHPPTAQHAVREGRTLAHNIEAAIYGKAKKAFRFTTIGQLATIGRRVGVANILGVNLSGFFAWWLWRTVYLFKLPRIEKKVRVALDWTLDLVFAKDMVRHHRLPASILQDGAPRVANSTLDTGGPAKPIPVPVRS